MPNRCDDCWNPSGGVLGDVGQPHLVGGLGAEQTLYEIVMDRRPGSVGQSTFLGEDRPDALLGAQSRNPVLAGDDPATGQLISDEPVPEGGVIGVDVAGSVDQVGVIPISL